MFQILRIKDVAPAVRALGLSCVYNSAYQEWKIDYRKQDARWTEDSAYFTTYPDDAVLTAREMSRRTVCE